MSAPITALVEKHHGAVQAAIAGKPLAFSEFMVALRAAAIFDPQINDCVRDDPGSVMSAVIQCAQLGLRPGRTFGHFALIPRRSRNGMTLTGQIEWRGYVHMLRMHNDIEELRAEVVWKGEKFKRDKVTQEITHETAENELEADIGRTEKDLVGAYCLVRIRGKKNPVSRVLSRRQIEHYRAKSDSFRAWQRDSSKKTPWIDDPEPMWRKTAIRRVAESGEIDIAGGVDLSALQEAPEEIRQTEAVVVETDYERRQREPFPSAEQRRAELAETVLALGAADQEAIDAMETAQLEELMAELRADGAEV